MKSKILGTLYVTVVTLLLVGIVTAFSFGYIGSLQDSIMGHFKKVENY